MTFLFPYSKFISKTMNFSDSFTLIKIFELSNKQFQAMYLKSISFVVFTSMES